MLPICGGGCPLSWLRRSDVPCPSFKHNLKERINIQLKVKKNSINTCDEYQQPHAYSAAGMAKAFFGEDSEEYKCLALLDENLSIVRAQVAQGFYHNGKAQLLELSRERSSYANNYMARKFFNVMIEGTKSYVFYKEKDHKRLVQSVVNSLEALASISRNIELLDVRPAQVQVLLNYASSCARLNITTSICSKIQRYLCNGKELKFSTITLNSIETVTGWEGDRALFLDQVKEIQSDRLSDHGLKS